MSQGGRGRPQGDAGRAALLRALCGEAGSACCRAAPFRWRFAARRAFLFRACPGRAFPCRRFPSAAGMRRGFGNGFGKNGRYCTAMRGRRAERGVRGLIRELDSMISVTYRGKSPDSLPFRANGRLMGPCSVTYGNVSIDPLPPFARRGFARGIRSGRPPRSQAAAALRAQAAARWPRGSARKGAPRADASLEGIDRPEAPRAGAALPPRTPPLQTGEPHPRGALPRPLRVFVEWEGAKL